MVVPKEWTIESVLHKIKTEHVKNICTSVYRRWDCATQQEVLDKSSGQLQMSMNLE